MSTVAAVEKENQPEEAEGSNQQQGANGSTTENSGTKTKRGKVQGDASSEFASVLNTKISELEKGLSSGNPMEREAAKMRRKQLRDVQRYLCDKQNSVEDRIAHIQGKYTQQVTEFLKMEKHYLEIQRELDLVTKERDKVQVELRKTNILRDRLEELCRQLQRENREVQEESKRRNEEEVKQRQALQGKFSQAISDVTVKMEQQQQERNKQLEENDALRVKLGEVLQQFDSFSQLLQSKDLEVQLANAKLEQQQHLGAQLIAKTDLLQNANENLSQANELMKAELEHHLVIKEQNAILHENNRELKIQVETYCDKFSDFQSTLTKSNEMFATLKKEIESHNKQRAHLTREREELRKRNDKAENNVIMLLEDNQNLKQKMERVVQALSNPEASGDPVESVRKLRVQKERLEGLCRALQTQLKMQTGETTPAAEHSEDSVPAASPSVEAE